MNPNLTENRRCFFRLRYPAPARPCLRTCGSLYDVTELSEKGLRFLVDQPDLFTAPDLVLDAVILFPCSNTCRVYGRVHRVEGNEVVVYLDARIPLSRMMAEQRRVVRDFGKESAHS